MELEDEKEYASENYKRLISQLPESLLKREGSAFERSSKSKKNSLNKLDLLYSDMGKVGDYIQRFTPCMKGCSACCHYPVTISEIEIRYIEKNTRFKRAKKALPTNSPHGKSCVFLNDDACSIYDARPYACRRHTVLTKTAYWCEPERSNSEQFPLLRFSGFDEAYDHIRRESNSYGLNDIREVFDIVSD